jgi:inorganic pyrophosphatase
MKVFIEQPVQENQKNVFDKKTGSFLRTVPIKLTYPFPYGYILDTLVEDGDNLVC